MKKITQATDIIAIVEQGDFNAELTAEIRKVLEALQAAAPPKGKAVKGEVSMKIKFAVEGVKVEIEAEFSSKVPKRPSAREFLFMTDDAALSVEHPNQHDMFPRQVRSAAE